MVFEGTGVALVTPFDQNMNVDHVSLERLVEFVIAGGVDYLVVLGTTAEAATLSAVERAEVINTVRRVNNSRLPMVLGVGGNNTAEVVEQLKSEALNGFDAVLSVSPYYNKPTQEGIYRHFEAIASQSPLPVIVYNVPSRTGSDMSSQTVLRLAAVHDNIIGIKEASGDITRAYRILRDCRPDFQVISGDDMITLPMTLAGGKGVISVIGQAMPEQFSAMVRAALQGDVAASNELHYEVMPAIDLIFEEGNPAGIKAMLCQMGVIAHQGVRLPLVEASATLQRKIDTLLTAGKSWV